MKRYSPLSALKTLSKNEEQVHKEHKEEPQRKKTKNYKYIGLRRKSEERLTAEFRGVSRSKELFTLACGAKARTSDTN